MSEGEMRSIHFLLYLYLRIKTCSPLAESLIKLCPTATILTGLEAEIRTLQRKLARRDNEILRQERELHKLRVHLILLSKRSSVCCSLSLSLNPVRPC